MSDILFAVLALSFLCLIEATVSAISHPHAPTRFCAIASMTTSCGDVR
jgi:hypothetical protein